MKHAQVGATIVEFALVLLLFLTFFLGVVDFARLLWTWNAASEATRWGARVAVVCDKGAAGVVSRMQMFLPQISTGNVDLNWYVGNAVDNACVAVSAPGSAPACTGVEVSIRPNQLNFTWISPIKAFGSVIPMPRFATYLPREIMGQNTNADGSAGPDSIECS